MQKLFIYKQIQEITIFSLIKNIDPDDRSSYEEKIFLTIDTRSGLANDQEWCKDMICYPAHFRLNNKLYMLYNGDNFGKEGFAVSLYSH